MHSSPSFVSPDSLEQVSAVASAKAGGDHDVLVGALEALQGNEHDASRWLAVALAFRAAGQPVQAIDACEACLRIDPQQVEGWFLIAELATAVGHEEMAADAYDVARQLAPGDARLGTRNGS